MGAAVDAPQALLHPDVAGHHNGGLAAVALQQHALDEHVDGHVVRGAARDGPCRGWGGGAWRTPDRRKAKLQKKQS